MTPQIKERIEKISRGEVPEGYKKTEFSVVPKDWKEYRLNDFCSFSGGGTPDTKREKYWNGSIAWISSSDIEQDDFEHINIKKFITQEAIDNSATKLCPPNTILVVNRVGVGKIAITNQELCTSQDFMNINQNIHDNWYLVYALYLRIQKELKQVQGSAIKGIPSKEMKKYSLCLPDEEYQKKVVDILTVQDKVIELKEKLVEEKQVQKKYLMQQLLTGKKRLEGFKDSWSNIKLSVCMYSRNEKQQASDEVPLMAFVAEKGVVSKGERYDRSFLVKDDLKKYKLTKLNDFIYSSNNLDVGSIGLNRYGTAVISDVYEIFGFKEGYIPTIISEIIKMPKTISEILKYRQGAFYGQYRIYASDFLNIKIRVPSFIEQQAIAEVLTTADKEIELLQQELEQENQKKKALMQLLLTGIVRVK